MKRTGGKPKAAGQRTAPKQDGEVRQSQMLTTFGPGAMVDLVDRAVLVGGLEHWQWREGKMKSLDDARLRSALLPRLKALAPEFELADKDYFREPPECDGKDPSPSVGVRVLEFPRWFVCQGCNLLARAADQFEPHKGRYRHHCKSNKTKRAVPVRFVGACRNGHLTDFPWAAFAHQSREEGTCDRPELYLTEGATGDLGKIRVECRSCGSTTALSFARAPIYPCGGDRPWLGGRAANEHCELKLELLVRTASDAYFSQRVSALRLPKPDPTVLELRVREPGVWKGVKNVNTREQLEMLMDLQDDLKAAFKGFPVVDVVEAIRAYRDEASKRVEAPIRTAEFQRIVSAPIEEPGVTPAEGVTFAAYRVPPEQVDLPSGVSGLIVVPEMREVRVQVSFSRFSSITPNLQGEYEFGAKHKPAPLTLPIGTQKWLPAAQIRGEGIFVELDEARVAAWELRDAVRDRTARLLRAFATQSDAEFPGARYYLLHSLSHLLLTAISLECGYAASALQERIYCQSAAPGLVPMAAIMLSTGTTGTEGTLGGLVEEGRRLRHHLREAWDLGRLCSNDPVCAAHDPSSESSDRPTEGAACHGCLYIAECSCEAFNKSLDRALVVPTIGNDPALAFFQERP